MLEEVSRRAIADTGAKNLAEALASSSRWCASRRTCRAIRAGCRKSCSAIRRAASPTASAQNRSRMFYTATGGNTPQWLVNRTAEEIANGECDVALLAGSEYIASLLASMKQGVDLGWNSGPDVDPVRPRRHPAAPCSAASALDAATASRFPSMSIRCREQSAGERRRTPAEHLKWPERSSRCSRRLRRRSHFLVSDLSLAGGNLDAEREDPLRRLSLHEISQRRDRSGHGGGGGDDERCQGARPRHSAGQVGIPARQRRCERHMECERARELSLVAGNRTVGKTAFGMAGIGVADLSFIDLYSCFPPRSKSAARNSASLSMIRAA